MGATPILVGIRAEVAQTMVDLGVDLRGIVTRAGLQEGLEYAWQAMEMRLVSEEGRAAAMAARAGTQPPGGEG